MRDDRADAQGERVAAKPTRLQHRDDGERRRVTGPAEISGQYGRMGDAILLAIIVIGCLTLIDFSTTLTIVDWGFLYGGYVALVILEAFFFSLARYAILTFGCAGLLPGRER